MRRSSSPRADEQRDREREREKDHERDRERERDRKGRGEKKDNSSRDRERDRRDKDSKHGGDDEKRRDRDRSRDDVDREFERETRKDRKDKDRDRDRDRDKDNKDRGKEEHKSRKDRDKERDRDAKDTGKEEPKPRKDRDKEEKEQSNKEREGILENKPTEDFEERIARMREARLKEKSSSRRKDEDDIAAWVNKSRKLEKVKKPMPVKLAAKAIEEPDEGEEVVSDDETSAYNSKHLAGLKIRHGLDKVMEGGEVVLTLKDSNILAGEDLNEDPDELENVSIAEQKARQSAYQAAKKKPGVHEDKFQNDMTGIRTILPKYDDAVNDEGVVLDESGEINEESTRKLKEVREKLQGAAESLNGPAGMTKDYYTQEEMLQFKKPKKQKKLRKKDMLDVDALEAEAKAAGLGAEDLGTRDGTRRPKEDELKAEADSRKQAYESAFAKALKASKSLREDAMEVDTEDDDELYRSLQKTRQAALKKRTPSVLGPQGVARLAAMHRESAESGDGEKDGEKPPVVITDTEEFCLSLQLDEALSRRSAGKDVFGDDDEDGPEDKPMEGQGGWIEVNATDNAGPALDIDKDDETSEELPIKEVSVGKGLAGVLQLLSERGNLKESVEWGGRNMDKKPSKLIGIMNDGDKAPERDILLDRRDEYGRVMTPKEAFRKLSHKFHGKGPGKKKQEKKMKQYEEELKLKQMRSGDTPLMSMEKMREAQARMHTPYIVISGHIKPGQTSDPRSGFATVEKEPIGSLTPMLGDKKVEHFLGIKRKPESGMPPLPPKKPKS